MIGNPGLQMEPSLGGGGILVAQRKSHKEALRGYSSTFQIMRGKLDVNS